MHPKVSLRQNSQFTRIYAIVTNEVLTWKSEWYKWLNDKPQQNEIYRLNQM